MAGHRDEALDFRASIRTGIDFQNASNDVSAIVHNAKPHSVLARCIGAKALAVILDAKPDMIGFNRESDFDPRGPRVLDGIVDPFLGNPIKLQADESAEGQYCL